MSIHTTGFPGTTQAHRHSPVPSAPPLRTITTSCRPEAEQYSLQIVVRVDTRSMSTSLLAFASEIKLRLEITYADSLFYFDALRSGRLHQLTPAVPYNSRCQPVYEFFVSYHGQECPFLSSSGFWLPLLQVSLKARSFILRDFLEVP